MLECSSIDGEAAFGSRRGKFGMVLSKQADGLPKAETVQQFRREAAAATVGTVVAFVPVRRLVSADLPSKSTGMPWLWT